MNQGKCLNFNTAIFLLIGSFSWAQFVEVNAELDLRRLSEGDRQLFETLIEDLKKTTSHKHTMIMIDQEGGRVARLKKPHWKTYPSAEYFGIKAE